MNKKDARQKRAKRTRMRLREIEAIRMCVNKTSQHTYAQIIAADNSKTIAAASTLDKSLRKSLKNTGNIDAAKEVGKLIAKRAQEAGIKAVAFDRSGFKYHGRIKALADAAREAGLEF